MIENERQYRITKAQAAKLAQARTRLEQAPLPPDVHPLLRAAELAGLQSQVATLHTQLAEYEALQTGGPLVLEVTSFDELPRALIRARIAAGLSQEALAAKLGLKKQQIQRYEATRYASASLQRIRQVLAALDVSLHADLFLPAA